MTGYGADLALLLLALSSNSLPVIVWQRVGAQG